MRAKRFGSGEKNNLLCASCGKLRTLIQIRRILGIADNIDLLQAIRDLKEKSDVNQT